MMMRFIGGLHAFLRGGGSLRSTPNMSCDGSPGKSHGEQRERNILHKASISVCLRFRIIRRVRDKPVRKIFRTWAAPRASIQTFPYDRDVAEERHLRSGSYGLKESETWKGLVQD